MNINLNDGEYFCGVFQCVESVAWKNDPTKFNNRIVGVKAFVDRYDNVSQQYFYINFSGDELIRMQQLEREFSGKRVLIPIVNNLKSDLHREKPYAFLDTYIPKGAQIIAIESDKKVSGGN